MLAKNTYPEDFVSYQQAERSLHRSTELPTKSRVRQLLFAVAVVIVLGVGATVSKTTLFASPAHSSFAQKLLLPRASDISVVVSGLSLRAANEYGPYDGEYSFFHEYPGSQLVEPYKMTTFTLLGSQADADRYRFLWYLEGRENQEPYEGLIVRFKGNPEPGVYALQIDAYDVETGEYAMTYNTHLIVKYVFVSCPLSLTLNKTLVFC